MPISSVSLNWDGAQEPGCTQGRTTAVGHRRTQILLRSRLAHPGTHPCAAFTPAPTGGAPAHGRDVGMWSRSSVVERLRVRVSQRQLCQPLGYVFLHMLHAFQRAHQPPFERDGDGISACRPDAEEGYCDLAIATPAKSDQAERRPQTQLGAATPTTRTTSTPEQSRGGATTR